MKKFILCLGIASVLIGTAVPALAGTLSASATNNFVSAWEKVTTSGDSATMKYGFNTFGINEDFTHTYHTKTGHKATVGNRNDYYYRSARAGSWARIEVTHAGNLVNYKMTW